jgi:hypothetical protein
MGGREGGDRKGCAFLGARCSFLGAIASHLGASACTTHSDRLSAPRRQALSLPLNQGRESGVGKRLAPERRADSRQKRDEERQTGVQIDTRRDKEGCHLSGQVRPSQPHTPGQGRERAAADGLLVLARQSLL